MVFYVFFLIETSFATIEVSIDELLKEVFKENIDIKSSQSSIHQSETRLDGSRGKFLPSMSLSATEFKQDQDNVFGNVGGGAGQNGLTLKNSAKMTIFNGFQDWHKNKQRFHELEKSKIDYQSTFYKQKEIALQSIFKILALQKDIKNINDKINVEKNREIDIKKRLNSQSSRRSDLLSIQSSILSSVNDLQTAKKDLNKEWLSLNEVAGRNISVSQIKFPEILLQKISIKINVDSIPEVSSASKDLSAAVYAKKSQLGQYYPSIDVSYNQYFQRPGFQSNNQWDMQITATINNPFDKERKSAIAEAAILENMKELALREKRLKKKIEFEKILEDFNNDIDRLKTLDSSVEIQSKLADSLKRDYNAGIVGVSDYLNAVTVLLQKKQQRDRLHLDQIQKLLNIKYTVESTGEDFKGI